MNCLMFLYDTNKKNSILLEILVSVFTVSLYFPDNLLHWSHEAYHNFF